MAAIAETTVRQWMVNIPDGTIREAVGVVEYEGVSSFPEEVRGLWKLRIVAGEDFRPVTNELELRNPKDKPFILGSNNATIDPSTPLFLELRYSAPDSTRPLFWVGASKINVTLNMV